MIALILANLPTIISAGEAGYKFVMSVRSAAQQSGEWTDAQETAFQASLTAEACDPAWQPDATAAELATVKAQLATAQDALTLALAIAPPPPPPPPPAPTVEEPYIAPDLRPGWTD